MSGSARVRPSFQRSYYILHKARTRSRAWAPIVLSWSTRVLLFGRISITRASVRSRTHAKSGMFAILERGPNVSVRVRVSSHIDRFAQARCVRALIDARARSHARHASFSGIVPSFLGVLEMCIYFKLEIHCNWGPRDKKQRDHIMLRVRFDSAILVKLCSIYE